MNQKLKIGIIGAGGIVRGFHLNPGWRADPLVEVVAVCDVNEAVARKLAHDFDIPHVFTDYRELLGLKEIDAVDVCTPNKLHPQVVIAALEAGKHVLCEKPLAVTIDEVLSIRAVLRQTDRILMTAQHHRFSPASVAIKAWVETGALGEVYHSRVNATRRNQLPVNPGFIDVSLSGGGPCLDIGVHALDTALWLMNFPKPVRVSGRAHTNFAKGFDIPGAWGEWDRLLFGVEDFAAGFVHFANGSTLSLEAILAFTDAIRQGKPSPVPIEQTLYVIAILEAIMKSSQLDQEITVPDLT